MSQLYAEMISRHKEIINSDDQEILRNSKITVIGCGGLGGTVIELLVRSGFENLTIVDEDVFDYTNLNRQIRSNIDTINKSKVKVTKEHALKINTEANINDLYTEVSQDNIQEIIQGSDVVIDALDNVYTRVTTSRYARKLEIPLVHAAVDKTRGQLTVFNKDTPSYEELFKLKSIDKSLDDSKDYLDSISKQKPQVLSTTPAIFASLEVNETIKLLIDKKNVLFAPKVLLWNPWDYSYRIIEF